MSIQHPLQGLSRVVAHLPSSSLACWPRPRLRRPHVRWLATQPDESVRPKDPPSTTSSTTSKPSSSVKNNAESRSSPSLSRLSPAPRSSQADTSQPFSYRSNITFSPDHSFETVIPRLPQKFGSNQRLTVPDETRTLLEEIVSTFRAPIRYAFAYGSGVFKQKGYDKNSSNPPMLDFIFAVSHPDHWHSMNMEQNPSHYPLISRIAGAGLTSKFQNVSPGVWFNPYVSVNGVTIKYGVTTVDTLTSDLLTWKTLYLSGRMHKPIRIIKDDPRIRLTQQVNLASAVRTALLTLPHSDFSERQLFEAIAGFSYAGDPRMSLPVENRGKVANIVGMQMDQFRELYWRLTSGMPGVRWESGKHVIEQDIEPRARVIHLRKLPLTLLRGIETYYVRSSPELAAMKEGDEVAFWLKVAGDLRLPAVIQTELKQIVRGPATIQSVKGLVTAGFFKSMRYSATKIRKYFRG